MSVKISGKDLAGVYEEDPMGRFEINTAWGMKRMLKSKVGEWCLTSTLSPAEGIYSQEEIDNLPEVFYTASQDGSVLYKVCVALGWQGGTLHQALEEIKRLVEVGKR